MTTFRSRILYTKDPKRRGNAILYGRVMSAFVKHQELFLVETDFGNQSRLTIGELEEIYEIGPKRDYSHWLADRTALQLQSDLERQCNERTYLERRDQSGQASEAQASGTNEVQPKPLP